MFKIKTYARWIAAPVVVCLLATTLSVGTAQAGLIASDSIASEQTVAADRTKVLDFMSRDNVQQELVNLGIDPNEAQDRVAALSDSEIAQLAANIDQDPAGEGPIGAIVGAALLVFLVLLITDIAGVTDAFDFDN